ncbi:MAG: hypothetical protein WBP33_14125 [Saprospiraceae bacterium]
MESKANIKTRNKLRNATIIGLVPAFLEGLLIYFADPKTDHWVLIQSVTFWFSCGFVVYLVEIGTKKIPTSILFTLILNIPWYIALTVVANKPDHLVPLIVSSIVMGAVIGFFSVWINKKFEK